MKTKELFFCAAIGVNASQVDELTKYAETQIRGDRSSSKIQMNIETPNWSRTLEITSDVEGKDFALSTIDSPAKEKGTRTLRIKNNMWNYFPKLKKKISVSSSMLLSSWMGSDFTNDDILKASSMNEDYTHSFGADIVKDGNDYKMIEHKARENSKVMWPKIVALTSKQDCLPREYHYYDKKNNLKRILTFSEIKTFDGHLFPTKWTMMPQNDHKKMTTIIYKDVKFNVSFKKDHFTQKNLTDY